MKFTSLLPSPEQGIVRSQKSSKLKPILRVDSLSLKSENNFPSFNNYNFKSSSSVIVEKNTILPKNIQLSNLEIKSSFSLNLHQADSLFISGDLIGAGILQNHKNIIYNGDYKY